MSFPNDICQRLVELRELHYGPRGRSAFARALDVPLTTYVHYEAGRTPPVDFLVKVAQVTHIRLDWLILGIPPRDLKQPDFTSVPRSLTFPEHQSLIPLVGSTSAGLAHYWSEMGSKFGAEIDQRLEQVLSRCLEKSNVSGQTEMSHERAGNSQPERGTHLSLPVALIQYSEPDSDGILEFISAPELKQKYPDAVAWRIDGDSMSPRYMNGDLVITSLSIPAVNAHPCVIRQQGQIGVNCKIYQTDGSDILLMPINPLCNPQRVPKSKINWAYRVISSIQLKVD